tara:strand:+ start:212 stop:691 length:480 start_codon:yes stop_codon:yes gene_type:complete
MKHLLLILFFIPFISIGQINTLDEIKRITSQETFERVCIENGYEKSKELQGDNDNIIAYALNPKFNDEREIIKGEGFAYYYISEKEMNSFRFGFMDNVLNYNNDYDNIFDKAKSNCDYVDVTERKDIAFSTYDCLPNGKLGFGKNEGTNIIHYFPKKTP